MTFEQFLKTIPPEKLVLTNPSHAVFMLPEDTSEHWLHKAYKAGEEEERLRTVHAMASNWLRITSSITVAPMVVPFWKRWYLAAKGKL